MAGVHLITRPPKGGDLTGTAVHNCRPPVQMPFQLCCCSFFGCNLAVVNRKAQGLQRRVAAQLVAHSRVQNKCKMRRRKKATRVSKIGWGAASRSGRCGANRKGTGKKYVIIMFFYPAIDRQLAPAC